MNTETDATAAATVPVQPHPLVEFWHYFRVNRGALAGLGFSTAVLDLAALGFLGMGAQPPTPEWGTMLANALQFIQRASWVVTTPGLAILITVLAFNLMGDGLRDALDPKLKR
jgi:ABC-type dipeptide/oligopeptide/nickel transport system permease subunit